jgi:glutamate carboxypeptidase
MKGGNVVMLYALKALKDAGALDTMSIRVVLTGDEERRGDPIDLAVEPLIEGAHWADYAIGFEDGDGDPGTAVTARRGSSSWSLRVSGRPAHSSQVFREDIGPGAIYEAARILDGFRTQLATEPNLTFNPGLIVGGTAVDMDKNAASGSAFGKNNVIAEFARVDGDLRAVSGVQLSMAVERMQQIAAENLPHTQAEISFRHRYPPMAPSAGNTRLLGLYDRVSRDLGFGPVSAVDPRRAGAADISFAAGHVEMALDGIGLMGDGGHTVNEIADLTSLGMQTKRAAVLLLRLSQLE